MVPLVEEGKRHTSERASVAYHRTTQGHPPRCLRVASVPQQLEILMRAILGSHLSDPLRAGI